MAFYCCDRKSPSGICAKLHMVAANNNRVHMTWSLYYSLLTPHICAVVLRAHPIHDESHNQHNANREVATTSPLFYNETHWSRVLFVKAAPGTTFTSWSQHYFVAIGKPERHVRKASNCGSKQNRDHTP